MLGLNTVVGEFPNPNPLRKTKVTAGSKPQANHRAIPLDIPYMPQQAPAPTP